MYENKNVLSHLVVDVAQGHHFAARFTKHAKSSRTHFTIIRIILTIYRKNNNNKQLIDAFFVQCFFFFFSCPFSSQVSFQSNILLASYISMERLISIYSYI